MVPPEAGGEGAASLFDASSDARVRIFRFDEKTQKPVTHGYFPPTVGEEDIAAAFGGGRYRAQLVSPDPATGLTQIRRSREFSIPGAYRPPQKINTLEDVSPHGGTASTPASAAGAVSMPVGVGGDDLMQVLKAGIINTLLEMMRATKETVKAPAMDPVLVELMRSQAQTQQQMMQFMLTLATKDNSKSEDKDMLTLLARMKEIVAPSGALPANGSVNPMEMFNTMLETFTRMREVADDIRPSREPEDPILGSIPKLVEVVAEQHQLNKEARAAVTKRTVPGPAGGVAQMPSVNALPLQQPEQPELAMWQKILRQQAGRLVAFAAAKENPDDIAGTALLFAPPAVKEVLALFFHRDEELVIADILTEIPQLTEHKEWVAEFVQAAQERLFPEEFTDADDDAGDDDNGGAS